MALSEKNKKILRGFWLGFLAVIVSLYIIYGQYLTPESITAWIKAHTHALLIVYSILCVIRGLTLIPATPFIFAGILLFPHSPGQLLAISLVCILLSSTLIYYGSGYMGFGDYFEKKYPSKIADFRQRLNHPSGFFFIAGWSLLPFTPTDLIVYVGGSIKLPFQKVIIPLIIGEGIICAVYIFNGVKLMQYIG